MHLVNSPRISAGKDTKSISYSYIKSLRIVRSSLNLHCRALSGLLLLIGLVFASVNAVSAQGCDIVFDFQEFDPGFINLYPGLDQPPPEFTSGGIVMDFSPYSATPGGDGSMEAASFVESPGGIDSPMALLLTATNARFDMTAANLPTGVSITGISIQLKGDGSGAPINLGVNGNFPFVGPGPQIPTTLPDGIVAEVIPGSNAFIATLILTGNITGLEIGGNIALSNLCVFGSDPSGGDTPGCMNASACNYNPNATVEDGSCNFDESHTFTMTVDFDQYPAETSWLLMDAQSDIVLASTPYTNGTEDFSTLVVSTSLCPGCYTLTVADEFGDGMCCAYGNGGYALTIDGQYVATGGEFTFSTIAEVCTPGISGPGCTYPIALNYDPLAIEDDGSCVFDIPICESGDADGDGVCDQDEVDGCTWPCSCNFNPEATDDDGSCLTADAIGMCGGSCLSDFDGDGICDDQDPCIGFMDECGVCNGNGATLACGCNDFPAGACDCEGNQFDALGICGGTCTGDIDGDGECDDLDCCVGGYDECGVCNGPGPVYDCGCNMIASGACDCNGNLMDAIGVCGGDCPSDLDGDGICDLVDDCVGFYDACGICNGPGAIFTCGCSPLPPGDCDCQGNQLDALGVCGGDCLSDTDGDGLCDADEVPGCMDGMACNYDPQATDDNGSCIYAQPAFDCNGDCLLDTDGDDICDDLEIPGCMEPEACNYNAQATDNTGCYYPLPSFNCAGECLEDLDDDGVCDGIELNGCTDSEACNFDPEATEEDGTCFYSGNLVDCNGNCLFDIDENGICDGIEETGCMDPEACNFNPNATNQGDEDFCVYPALGYNCGGMGINLGCMEVAACNFDPNATVPADEESCLYALPGYDCEGVCLDFDEDGTCDIHEVSGCTYSNAENFNPEATEDNGTCTFPNDNGPIEGCPDVNGDGIVSVPDLLLLLGAFGQQIDC